MVWANSSWRAWTPAASFSSICRRSRLEKDFLKVMAAFCAAAMAASHSSSPARDTSSTVSPDQGDRTGSCSPVSTHLLLMKQPFAIFLSFPTGADFAKLRPLRKVLFVILSEAKDLVFTRNYEILRSLR